MAPEAQFHESNGMDERTRELAGEMHRWSDLIRTGNILSHKPYIIGSK